MKFNRIQELYLLKTDITVKRWSGVYWVLH